MVIEEMLSAAQRSSLRFETENLDSDDFLTTLDKTECSSWSTKFLVF